MVSKNGSRKSLKSYKGFSIILIFFKVVITLKSFFEGIAIYLIGKIKSNHGKIEAQKDVNEIFDNLEGDGNYNPNFIKEMNEIKKEKSINIEKFRDLFDY